VKMASSSCARIPPDSTSAEAERALDLFGVYAAPRRGGRGANKVIDKIAYEPELR
jgi:hypothetical protein